jgi:hypothetical protein
MSVGLETNDIIQVLGRLSKIPLPAKLQRRIADWTSSYGKIRLVLKHNRYFLESVDQKFLVPLMNDPVIAGCRVEKQDEEGQQVHGLEKGTAPSKDLIIPGGAESRGEVRHENDIIGAVIGLDRGETKSSAVRNIALINYSGRNGRRRDNMVFRSGCGQNGGKTRRTSKDPSAHSLGCQKAVQGHRPPGFGRV